MITVDRHKQQDGAYTYTLNIGTQDPFNHVNGTMITLSHDEAAHLLQALAQALGLGLRP